MNFTFVKIFYIFSLPFHGMPLKIFNFHKHEPTTSGGTFSTMTLTNVPNETLPEIFTICSTHKQFEWNTANTHHIYTIYRDENHEHPWFSIGFWESRTLWARMDSSIWYNTGNFLPLEMIRGWITICVQINDRDSTISSSIGGHSVVVEKIGKIHERPRFYLKLGLCDEILLPEDNQFNGTIAKIRKEFNSLKKKRKKKLKR